MGNSHDAPNSADKIEQLYHVLDRACLMTYAWSNMTVDDLPDHVIGQLRQVLTEILVPSDMGSLAKSYREALQNIATTPNRAEKNDFVEVPLVVFNAALNYIAHGSDNQTMQQWIVDGLKRSHERKER